MLYDVEPFPGRCICYVHLDFCFLAMVLVQLRTSFPEHSASNHEPP